MVKKLFVFDFDQTIIDINSDAIIEDLGKINGILQDIECKPRQFVNYIQDILNIYLKTHSIDSLKQKMEVLELTQGFKELLIFLQKNNEIFDIIVISGGNTLFLSWIIKYNQLQDILSTIFAFEGKIQNNMILLKDFHSHNCPTCEIGQCKKKILQDYLNDKQYDQIFYAGDGSNDYCPITILRNNDIVFPRINYELYKILKNNNVICRIVEWEDGSQILDTVKREINKGQF